MQYLIIFMFCFSSLPEQTSQRFECCLPKGTHLTDVVSSRVNKGALSAGPAEQVTVKEKLIEMKARCKKGKLVDSSGKQIVFYRLTGCWGNPPADYQEILERQRSEIEKLKRRYTVVEMTCNPSGGFPH